MLLCALSDDPQTILNWIKQKVQPCISDDLSNYDAHFFLIPTELEFVGELFVTKFDELFGSQISGRVFSPEQAKHAKTVVPSDTELFTSFGYKNEYFGNHRLHIPLPKKVSPVTLMAVGYYVIGRIQKQNNPYFKDNIEAYTQFASKVFGNELKPIVD